MTEEYMTACFSLGVRVAEHVHGIRRTGNDKSSDEMFETLKSVADGGLTLLNTPEEIKASLPTPPAGFKLTIDEATFREMIRNGRELDRTVAQILRKTLPQ